MAFVGGMWSILWGICTILNANHHKFESSGPLGEWHREAAGKSETFGASVAGAETSALAAECAHLRSYVGRLNAELARHGGAQVEQEGEEGEFFMPPWERDATILPPLLAAYEARIAETEGALREAQEALQRLKAEYSREASAALRAKEALARALKGGGGSGAGVEAARLADEQAERVSLLSREAAVLREEVSTLEDENERLRRECGELRGAREAASARAGEVSGLRNELLRVSRECEGLRSELGSAASAAATLRALVGTRERERDTARARASQLRSALEEVADRARSESSDLSRELREAWNRGREVRERLDACERERDEALEHRRALEEQLEEVERGKSVLGGDLARLKAEVDRLNGEVRTLRSQLSGAEEKEARAWGERAKMETERDVARQEVARLLERRRSELAEALAHEEEAVRAVEGRWEKRWGEREESFAGELEKVFLETRELRGRVVAAEGEDEVVERREGMLRQEAADWKKKWEESEEKRRGEKRDWMVNEQKLQEKQDELVIATKTAERKFLQAKAMQETARRIETRCSELLQSQRAEHTRIVEQLTLQRNSSDERTQRIEEECRSLQAQLRSIQSEADEQRRLHLEAVDEAHKETEQQRAERLVVQEDRDRLQREVDRVRRDTEARLAALKTESYSEQQRLQSRIHELSLNLARVASDGAELADAAEDAETQRARALAIADLRQKEALDAARKLDAALAREEARARDAERLRTELDAALFHDQEEQDDHDHEKDIAEQEAKQDSPPPQNHDLVQDALQRYRERIK